MMSNETAMEPGKAVGFRALLGREWRQFTARKSNFGVLIGFALVPALVATLNISAGWDTAAGLKRLPAGWVNLDAGTQVSGTALNLGQTLSDKLLADPPVHFVRYPSAESARAAVNRGEVYFAVILPADLSRKAFAGQSAARGEIETYIAEGTSLFTENTARRIGQTVEQNLNQNLNEKRFEKIAVGLKASATGLNQLKAGAGKLKDGADRLLDGTQKLEAGSRRLLTGLEGAASGSVALHGGSGQLSSGVLKLTSGLGQATTGVQTLQSNLPPAAQLEALKLGSETLALNSEQLRNGLTQLGAVLGRAQPGASADPAGLKRRLAPLSAGGQRLARGADGLNQGVVALTGGVTRLSGGVNKLAASLPDRAALQTLSGGAATLDQRSGQLARGLSQAEDGAQTLASNAARLRAGAQQLASGALTLYGKVPSGVGGLTGDPAGLAASAAVRETTVQKVQNSGAANTPHFAAFALFIGAILTALAFNFNLLPVSERGSSQAARALSKLALPMALGLLQAAVMAVLLQVVFGFQVQGPLGFHLVLAALSLTYVAIVGALMLLLGVRGLFVTPGLLFLQFASTGGITPIELSPPFFQWLNPLLPMTYGVRGLKSAMFGAYDGDWVRPALILTGWLIGAVLVGVLLGRRRWQWAPDEAYSPTSEAVAEAV